MGGCPSRTALGAAPEVTSAGFAVRPYQAPAPSGSGKPARLALISCVVRASWLVVRFWSDRGTVWLLPEKVSSAPTKLLQFAPIWTVLTVGASRAVVWCSAWDRACRLSAGPAIAANTHPQTSRASASVVPAAEPTARLRLCLPGTDLTPLPLRAARPRRPGAARR